MEDYLINNNTLYLVKNYEETLVFEEKNDFVVKKELSRLLDDNCKFHFSSLKGRMDSTAFLLSMPYKCPIIISEKDENIFFPLKKNNEIYVWINYQMIDSFKKDDKKVNIYFKNGEKLSVFSSLNIIKNQILKSSRLESILKSKNR